MYHNVDGNGDGTYDQMILEVMVMMMACDDDQDVANAGGHVDCNDERISAIAIAIMLLTMKMKAAMSMLMVSMSSSMIMSCQSIDDNLVYAT